ncbi:hypothetical protein EDB81DRAFT_882347 [Dactylonectria macrodidyma]|uniref:Uncharacterized protein n=1 Tax=Dactylonectria macrodidyma TaxID=307937 RepID=A0A9P9F2V5_9HYPO|nr:hypothetical protein EDB81DRAFT_882347 [Dactylonectria macrodidyma]
MAAAGFMFTKFNLVDTSKKAEELTKRVSQIAPPSWVVGGLMEGDCEDFDTLYAHAARLLYRNDAGGTRILDSSAPRRRVGLASLRLFEAFLAAVKTHHAQHSLLSFDDKLVDDSSSQDQMMQTLHPPHQPTPSDKVRDLAGKLRAHVDQPKLDHTKKLANLTKANATEQQATVTEQKAAISGRAKKENILLRVQIILRPISSTPAPTFSCGVKRLA